MKTQEHVKGNANAQGNTKSDRNFVDQKQVKQQAGVSNGGSQHSDQTSGRDAVQKPRRRML